MAEIDSSEVVKQKLKLLSERDAVLAIDELRRNERKKSYFFLQGTLLAFSIVTFVSVRPPAAARQGIDQRGIALEVIIILLVQGIE